MIKVANLRRGGFCNRVLLYLHVCATAITNNQQVTIINDQQVCDVFEMRQPKIHEFTVIFENWCDFKWKVAQKLNSYLIRICKGNEQNTTRIQKKFGGDVFIRTYYFRDVASLMKEQEKLRLLFSLPKDVKEKATTMLNKYKQNGKTVVAVHMRKGDYKEWRGGVFFYSDDEYIERMNALANADINLHFHIISNEKVALIEIQKRVVNSATVSTSSGSMIEDLAVLLSADYVMGSQSTFSAVAAFLGNKPLLFLKERTFRLSYACFLGKNTLPICLQGKRLFDV